MERARIVSGEWKTLAENKTVPEKAAVSIEKKEIKSINEQKQVVPQKFYEKVTIKAHGLALSDALKPLAETVGCHVILGPGVDNSAITIDLTDVTVVKALNTILYSLGYDFKLQDGDLIILARETRIYRVVLPPLVQNFNDVTSNESSVESNNSINNSQINSNSNNSNGQQIKLGTKILVSNNSVGISFWDDVQENLDSLISEEGKFSINKPAGVVIVTDTPMSLNEIDKYFEDLNHRVSQQIEVDVKVVEVSLNKENKFGVDWNALAGDLKTLNSLGLKSNFAAQNFTSGSFLTFMADGAKPGSGISENGIKLVIDALAKQGEVEIVSQPRVRILNNQVSVIQVGSTQSYVDHSTIEVTQTGTISSISTSQVQEGVTMRLLGNIVGNQVYLSVTPVVTTIDNIRSINTGNTTIEAPQTTTKSINTLVKVSEGETVAIGGLMTSYHQKNKQEVPIISKIPMLGKMFQYSAHKSNKSELVIFITPKRG